MKKVIILFCLLFISSALWAKSVSREDAQKIAVSFYRLNNPSGIQNPQIGSFSVNSWQNIHVYYVFRFTSGGFVLVAADDASIPILAYSFENNMPEVIENPALKEWLDNYSRDISYIINNHLNNKETLKKWNSIQNGVPLAPTLDVPPLLTTLWHQGCYYNEMCPPDANGLCGHTMVGCVATAMAQIMKYHNFPPQGVGQNSYDDPPYGRQSADFGNTTYDWSSMPNSVTSSNPAVATINYHAGVSVYMQYGNSASGAFNEAVPGALLNYFNYSPDIDIKYKYAYPNVEDFKTLLHADLDQSLPIWYAGSGTSGHAFVCDGYRMSDGKFHFNWGFGNGLYNGYYAIGYLNPGIFDFNIYNTVVVHIKPYNPNLIVRITHPLDKAVIGAGYSVDIKAKTVRGTPTTMKIFIDSIEKFSVNADSIEYTWYTSTADLGNHIIKSFAYNATDTVYYKILVNVSEWISQPSGFTASRAVTYMSAVDSNIVWGTAADPNNLYSAGCSDFTRTTNGGTTWNPGVITNTSGLLSSMIFAMDSLKAYVAMFRVSGTKPKGIYVTTNAGVTWTRQATASFSNSASWPDVIHFFNSNDGVAIGDPINGRFEIYTTTNAGTNWVLIPPLGNPTALSGEFGLQKFYSAVHDTIWFGTSMGRVYKSVDKGWTWTVSTVGSLGGRYAKPMFRDGQHGLLLDGSSGTGKLCETSDGGATWTLVNFTGPHYWGDIAFVPGTPNTYVRSDYFTGDMGCAYSFDGGHSWSDFIGTTGSPFYGMAWVNRHCGWSGGVNTSATENGVYKFIGLLQPLLPSPQNVQATTSNHDVNISWWEPAYDPTQMTLQGYNIRRNGMKINTSLITGLSYTDHNVPSGYYTYCVSAVYDAGESKGSCKTVDVAVGIASDGNQVTLSIYPNPASNTVHITFNNYSKENTVLTIRNILGEELLSNQIQSVETVIDVSNLPNGLYFVGVNTGNKQMVSTKLIILK